MMLNSEYNVLFYENCIELKYFDQNMTFYKDFIQHNLDNPEAMKYELEQVYEKIYNKDIDKIISYFKKAF